MPILGIIASQISGHLTPPEVLAYDSIATYTGDGTSGTVTFSSIPSTYTHLQLRISALGTAGAGGYPTSLNYFRLNSDSNSANYKVHLMRGDGATTSAGTTGNPQGDFLYLPGGDSSNPAVAIIDILNYASTSQYKTLRSNNGSDRNGSGSIWFNSMLYMSSSAITNISLQGDPTYNGNWASGSKFALYGIKG